MLVGADRSEAAAGTPPPHDEAVGEVPPPNDMVPGAAFEARFAELFTVAYRIGHRLLGDRDDAADVAQEACARAFVRWDRLVRRGDPAPWVSRVAANLAIDRWRRRRRDRSDAGNLPCPTEQASTGIRVDLHRALRTLPRRQREVVVLRWIADLPEVAVADLLGCSVGAVKQHNRRGLDRLQAELRGRGPTEEDR